MASKLDFLLNILENNNFRHLKNSLPTLTEKKYRDSRLNKSSLDIYKALEGLLNEYPFRQPKWDLEFETFALKLDEAHHFNRYRSVTLTAEIYNDSPFFIVDNYKRYCRQFEVESLKAAKHATMWTDQESEKQFGDSQECGDLAFEGSSKWRQRAFYDFLEDSAAVLLNIKLIRVSIHDNMMINNQLVKLNTLLISQNPQNEKYITNFLTRKISM